MVTVNQNLLFLEIFVFSGTLLGDKYILTCLQLYQVTLPLFFEIFYNDIFFLIHLVYQLSFDKVLHSKLSLVLLVDVLICFFWSEMRFIVLFFNNFTHLFSVPVILDLLGKEAQVSDVVFLLELLIMLCNYILLLLLPSELFSFKISNLLHFLALLYKTVMSLLVDLLQI